METYTSNEVLKPLINKKKVNGNIWLQFKREKYTKKHENKQNFIIIYYSCKQLQSIGNSLSP